MTLLLRLRSAPQRAVGPGHLDRRAVQGDGLLPGASDDWPDDTGSLR